MDLEYAFYICVPMFVGFVTERYKDMSTLNYSLFVISIFITLKFTLFFLYGGELLPGWFEITVGGAIVIATTALFHFQKYLRRKKRG